MPSLDVSDDFKRKLKYEHGKRTIVQILADGELQPQILYVDEGSITEDATNDVQGQCDVTLIDPTGELVPDEIDDLLYPGVNEIQVTQECRFPDGTTLTVPMGIFGFEGVEVHTTGQSFSVKVSGYDRSKRLSNDSFDDLWTVPSGANVTDAILNIILSSNPRAVTNFAPSPITVNQQVYDRSSDKLKACLELAAAGGLYLRVDRLGVYQLDTVPTLTGTPDWVFAEGSEATTLELTKTLSQAQYNRFLEIGEGGDIAVPFSSAAQDDWSVAKTGRRTATHVSSLYTSQGQCAVAAQARLERERGTTEGIVLQTIPNPTILPFDTGQIENEKAKVDAVYIFDRVVTPLTTGRGQYLSSRKRVYGS